MNIFGQLYNTVVFRPLLNLLQLLYDLTGDIGWAIVIMAVAVNLVMWPLFIKTYLNSQKLRYLQPQLKAIQEKYKDNREQLLQEQIKFNRRHGISNGSLLLTLILQILIASGLYVLTRQVSEGIAIEGLYEPVFERTTAEFNREAFGFLNIGLSGSDIIFLPVLVSFLSFCYGYYTNKLAPKLPQLPKPKKAKKKKDEPESPLDPEAMQKAMQVQLMFVLPVILFVLNYGFTIGINLYLLVVNVLSLLRQIFVTQYYKHHLTQFFHDLAETDPDNQDNLEAVTEGILANDAIETKILEKDARTVKIKKKTAVKKKSDKKSPKTAKKKSKKKSGPITKN